MGVLFWRALDLFKNGIPPTKARAKLVSSLIIAFLLGLIGCTMLSSDFCPPWMKTHKVTEMDGPAFWVKVMRGNSTITTNVAPTIREKKLSATIDGLKNAVWHYLAEKEQTTVKVSSMKVFQSDGVTEIPKASAPLVPNSEETAYHVVVAEIKI